MAFWPTHGDRRAAAARTRGDGSATTNRSVVAVGVAGGASPRGVWDPDDVSLQASRIRARQRPPRSAALARTRDDPNRSPSRDSPRRLSASLASESDEPTADEKRGREGERDAEHSAPRRTRRRRVVRRRGGFPSVLDVTPYANASSKMRDERGDGRLGPGRAFGSGAKTRRASSAPPHLLALESSGNAAHLSPRSRRDRATPPRHRPRRRARRR